MLGATVIPVTSGNMTLKDATNEAIRDWCCHPADTYYIIGSTVGPHPYPDMVARLQSVILSLIHILLAPVYDKEIQADLKRIVCYGYRDTAKGRIVDGTGENRLWKGFRSTLCKGSTPAFVEADKTNVLFRSQEELYKEYKNTL